MEIIIILLLIVFTITLSSQSDAPEINKKLKNINLFLEVFESNTTKMFLVYEEDNNKFVCQAPTEKELHVKLFEIFKGREINMRVKDVIVNISFEVFDNPIN